MKCGGLEPHTHDVMKELARVHLYIKKFQTHPQPTRLSFRFSPSLNFFSRLQKTTEETKTDEKKKKKSSKSAAKTAPTKSSKGGKRTRSGHGNGARH